MRADAIEELRDMIAAAQDATKNASSRGDQVHNAKIYRTRRRGQEARRPEFSHDNGIYRFLQSLKDNSKR